uniref:CUE domain-containing protein n=1 Tax=Arundo donax TaxID=35708 RepID=A0A0A9DKY7_ARUDO
MAAAVAGSRKRGAAAFLDDPLAFPFPFPVDPPRLAKRGRCSPSAVAADVGLSFPLEFDPIDALRLIFPGADPQVLRDYLEASGNVLDAAIRAYKDHLANRNAESTSSITYAPSRNGDNDVVSSKGDAPVGTIPTNGSEWAELVVKEMSSASDLVDAKKRAFRILELFEKSTAQIDHDAKCIQEHKIVKQMLGGLLHQNGVLKRAFLIQHNRLKEYEDMVEERSQFKQIVEKYQEKIKALEEKNYILSFHLQQTNQHSNIYRHRNPDIF